MRDIIKDTMIDFVLEYMKSHDPAFLTEFQKQFPTSGNVFFEMLDWMDWIFD